MTPIWVKGATITFANGEIYMTSVKADPSGNLIMAGTMTNPGTVNFGDGVTLSPETSGNGVAWIAKVSAAGVCQWATMYGGAGADDDTAGFNMGVDGSGNMYMG